MKIRRNGVAEATGTQPVSSVDLGLTTDAAAASDDGTATLIALIKRMMTVKDAPNSRDFANEQTLPLGASAVFLNAGPATYIGDRGSVENFYLANTPFTMQKVWYSSPTTPINRTLTDAVLNGTTTMTSAGGTFSDYDKGSNVFATGVPAGTVIASVTNSTTVTLSQSATVSSTVTATLVNLFSGVSAVSQRVLSGFNIVYDVINSGERSAPYYKLKITNGATPQTAFSGTTGFLHIVWLNKEPYAGVYDFADAPISQLTKFLRVNALLGTYDPKNNSTRLTPSDKLGNISVIAANGMDVDVFGRGHVVGPKPFVSVQFDADIPERLVRTRKTGSGDIVQSGAQAIMSVNGVGTAAMQSANVVPYFPGDGYEFSWTGAHGATDAFSQIWAGPHTVDTLDTLNPINGMRFGRPVINALKLERWKSGTLIEDAFWIGSPGMKVTAITAGSNNAVLPQATVNVTSTTGFASSGTIYIETSLGSRAVDYTGVTATSFTGCTGGTGTMLTGARVSNSPLANGDPMDGSAGSFFFGPNGQPIALDPMQSYPIRVFGGLLGNAVQILTIQRPFDGKFVIFHTVQLPGAGNIAAFDQFDLPFTSYVIGAAGAGAAEFRTSSWSGVAYTIDESRYDRFNSTTLPLAPGASFTGAQAFRTLGLGQITVTVYSNVASAVGGVKVKYSMDGGNTFPTILKETYDTPGAGRRFVFPPVAGSLAIVEYNNSDAQQDVFALETDLTERGDSQQQPEKMRVIKGKVFSIGPAVQAMPPVPLARRCALLFQNDGLVPIYGGHDDTLTGPNDAGHCMAAQQSTSGIGVPGTGGTLAINLAPETQMFFIAGAAVGGSETKQRNPTAAIASAGSPSNVGNVLAKDGVDASLTLTAQAIRASGYSDGHTAGFPILGNILIGFTGRKQSGQFEQVTNVATVGTALSVSGPSITSGTIVAVANALYSVSISTEQGGDTVTLSSSAGGPSTWTPLDNQQASGANRRIKTYYAYGTPSNNFTVTATWVGNNTAHIVVSTDINADPTTPIQDHSTSFANSASVTGPALAATAKGLSRLAVACDNTTGSVGAGYTSEYSDHTQDGIFVESKQIAATGTETATATLSGGKQYAASGWTVLPRPAIDPVVTVSYDLGAGTLPTTRQVVLNNNIETDYPIDVTSDRTWAFTDIASVRVTVTADVIGAAAALIDYIFLTQIEGANSISSQLRILEAADGS